MNTATIITLIGLSGAGKSSVGRMLAGQLSWALFDTDAQIEWSSGQSIPAIFASKGEAGFRDLEESVVRQALSGQRRVVATGGGAILREASRQLMRERSLVIWLDAPTEALIARLRLHDEQRPLLASGDPVARLNALRNDREPIYAATAHLRIETAGLRHAEIVAQILDHYNHHSAHPPHEHTPTLHTPPLDGSHPVS